ncbi:uncharacterized protein LOC111865290 [Cryptotermes secundus]|uniref:uncharacterized protein LOC111865290 n=1 Tax=Cryptotermes secundus TaxID=105785 RepID=UPI000CD7B6C1|nr:uncharacterized protein LOC111865290 [Cryptotermes secundus]
MKTWLLTAHAMKACTVVMIICILMMSSAQQNVTTEDSNIITPEQISVMDAKKVGDSCTRDDQCTKNLGRYSECKTGTCICKNGSRKSSDTSKCEKERSFAVRHLASMTWVALMAVLNTAL